MHPSDSGSRTGIDRQRERRGEQELGPLGTDPERSPRRPAEWQQARQALLRKLGQRDGGRVGERARAESAAPLARPDSAGPAATVPPAGPTATAARERRQARVDDIRALLRRGRHDAKDRDGIGTLEDHEMGADRHRHGDRAIAGAGRLELSAGGRRRDAVGGEHSRPSAAKRPAHRVVDHRGDEEARRRVAAEDRDPGVGEEIPRQIARLAQHLDSNRPFGERRGGGEGGEIDIERHAAVDRSGGARDENRTREVRRIDRFAELDQRNRTGSRRHSPRSAPCSRARPRSRSPASGCPHRRRWSPRAGESRRE